MPSALFRHLINYLICLHVCDSFHLLNSSTLPAGVLPIWKSNTVLNLENFHFALIKSCHFKVSFVLGEGKTFDISCSRDGFFGPPGVISVSDPNLD